MSQREPPSMMLVLSAVDLLLASVVSGVVLLVTLVGAPQKHPGPNLLAIGNTMAILELYTAEPAAGEPTPEAMGAEALGPPVVLPPRALELPTTIRPFTYSWRLRTYAVTAPTGVLQLQSVGMFAYAIVYRGEGGTNELVLQCQQPQWSIMWSVRQSRVTTDTCVHRHGLTPLTSSFDGSKLTAAIVDHLPASGWKMKGTLGDQSGVEISPDGATQAPPDASSTIFEVL